MGKNITAILAAAACAVLCGCMSDNEMYLRKKDIEAKASHPASFQPLVLSGPIELKQEVIDQLRQWVVEARRQGTVTGEA